MSGINIPNNIVFNPADGDFSPVRQSLQNRVIGTENADPALGADFAATIDKALQLNDTQDLVVAEVRKAIADNNLDTPENIRDAAANMLRFGI